MSYATRACAVQSRLKTGVKTLKTQFGCSRNLRVASKPMDRYNGTVCRMKLSIKGTSHEARKHPCAVSR
jgi:hypothetical protein